MLINDFVNSFSNQANKIVTAVTTGDKTDAKTKMWLLNQWFHVESERIGQERKFTEIVPKENKDNKE